MLHVASLVCHHIFLAHALMTLPAACYQVQSYGAAAVSTATPTLPGVPFSFVVTYTCQTVALKTAIPATRLVRVVCATGKQRMQS